MLLSAPVPRHHAFAAAFDENKPINLEGVVTTVELVNPHAWIWMDVTNEDGTVTNWGLEGGPPVNLFRNITIKLGKTDTRVCGRRFSGGCCVCRVQYLDD